MIDIKFWLFKFELCRRELDLLTTLYALIVLVSSINRRRLKTLPLAKSGYEDENYNVPTINSKLIASFPLKISLFLALK